MREGVEETNLAVEPETLRDVFVRVRGAESSYLTEDLFGVLRKTRLTKEPCWVLVLAHNPVLR